MARLGVERIGAASDSSERMTTPPAALSLSQAFVTFGAAVVVVVVVRLIMFAADTL